MNQKANEEAILLLFQRGGVDARIGVGRERKGGEMAAAESGEEEVSGAENRRRAARAALRCG